MVYFGPEKLSYIGKKLENILSNDKEKLLDFLNSYKEKLDVFHKHLILVTVSSDNDFALSAGFNPEGKFFYGISITSPFLKSPSLYKIKDYVNEEFEALYNNIFNKSTISKIQAGIIRFPLQTHFLAVGGEKSLVSKEMFSEEITGKPWLNFAKIIDDDAYEKIMNINGKKIGFLKMSLTDDGIYFFGIINDPHKNLYAEFFRFLKEKYKLPSGKYYPVMEIKDKVVGTFKLELEEIFSEEKWKILEKFIDDFEKFRRFVAQMGG